MGLGETCQAQTTTTAALENFLGLAWHMSLGISLTSDILNLRCRPRYIGSGERGPCGVFKATVALKGEPGFWSSGSLEKLLSLMKRYAEFI